MKETDQPGLFAHEPPPKGFLYRPDFISEAEERNLVGQIATLPFESFQFHGFLGKRRVVSFGWRYNFKESALQKANDIPPFLFPLRERAAAFAGLATNDFPHVLVTEYASGAGIGWHRDKAMFDQVVGISLLSACDFRFRQEWRHNWKRLTLVAAPRSAYLLAVPPARSGNTVSRRWIG